MFAIKLMRIPLRILYLKVSYGGIKRGKVYTYLPPSLSNLVNTSLGVTLMTRSTIAEIETK